MQLKTTRGDILWNYAGTAFSMLGNFLLLPFLVYFLTGEELGLWYVYIAVGNLVMLFEFGFNPTFARNFAFCWSGAKELTREGCTRCGGDDSVNPTLVAHLLAACKMVYSRITIAALFVLAIPGTFYLLSITAEMPLYEVLLSWAVYSTGVLFNLYYLYYAAMLRGIGAIASENQIKIAGRIMQIVVTAVLLLFGFGILAASLGFVANALIYRVLGYFRFWRNPQVKALGLRDVIIDGAERRRLYGVISYNAYKDGGVQIANYVSTQASSLVCSSLLGLEEAGAFSIALQFATGIGNMSLAYMNSCRPMMQSSYQRDDFDLLRLSLGKCTIAYIVAFSVMFLTVLFVAYPLLDVFKPDSSFDSGVYCGVCLYILLLDWHSLFASMLCNMNTIPYARAYILTSLVGIGLSIALIICTDLGVWGLVLGLAIPQLLYNNWKWPLEASKRLGTTVRGLIWLGIKTLCGR